MSAKAYTKLGSPLKKSRMNAINFVMRMVSP